MSPKKVRPGPGQEAFPIEGMAPSIPPIDSVSNPDIVDFSGDGVSTPLIEGWSVLHKTINEIARARSNQGFAKLSVNSQPVKEFADQIDESPEEAQRKVAAAGDARWKGGSSLNHYDRAQLRLNDYNQKQVERARNDPRMLAIGNIALVTQSLPMSVKDVEHTYFYSNNGLEYSQKQQRRQAIARFVKKHS